MSFDILVVDDEQDICNLVAGILNDEGYSSRIANNCVEAIEAIKSMEPHLIVLDVWLGDDDKDGLRLLDIVQKEHQSVPVIMMSGHGTIETAVNSIKHGAYDFIEKPFEGARLIISVQKAIEAFKLKRENEELKIKARVGNTIIGQSNAITCLKKEIEKVAELQGRCLIQGPAGSDKEEVAREIFKLSNNFNSIFLAVNCQVSNQTQLELDLFGAEINNDDFTKQTTKIGLLEKATGGILYLDEITYLSGYLQTRLLKMLKENVFCRTGSPKKIPFKGRIIGGFCVKNELFNEELYYRLSANLIKIPPLSTRPSDIPLLLDHHMEQSSRIYGVLPKKFTEEAKSLLQAYSWPGDVIQLRNLVDWVLVSSNDSREIKIKDLPREITEEKSFAGNSDIQFMSVVSRLSIKEAREIFEKEYFVEQLRRFSGNVSKASKFIGMERSALHRKLKSLNIKDIPDEQNEIFEP
jgi:two-component system nitrogen regulation response regulator NtrX